MLKFISAIALALALCTSALPVHATSKAANIDKKQAVLIAKEAQSGKVLKITEQSDTFVVRILKPKGRVIDVIVSKRTGQVQKGSN